jgi:hypothetical protein
MSRQEKGAPSPDFPVEEIKQELARLQSEKRALVEKRNELYHTVVEAGNDTGFALTKVLRQLKQVDQRIEQWTSLLKAKGVTH